MSGRPRVRTAEIYCDGKRYSVERRGRNLRLDLDGLLYSSTWEQGIVHWPDSVAREAKGRLERQLILNHWARLGRDLVD